MTYTEFKQYDEANKDDYFDNIISADSFFVFYPQCKISKNKIIEREPGNNIVFHYYYKSSSHPDIADDGFAEYIEFEIPYSKDTNFYFTDDPTQYNTTYQWLCFCDYPDSLEARMNKGSIALARISSSS